MPRRVQGPATAAATTTGAAPSEELSPDEANRRTSLASRLEDLAHHDALAQAVKEGRPEVTACRRVLLKPLARRSLDDIYSVRARPCLYGCCLLGALTGWMGAAQVAAGGVQAPRLLLEPRRVYVTFRANV